MTSTCSGSRAPRPMLVAGGQSALAADYQTQGLTAADNALPVFYEALRTKMNFTLGWKDGADPKAWRAAGLAKARDLMIPDNDRVAFQPAVIDEIDRGSYVARKVAFNVTAESRVLALVLVPKGNGPFPAALMLHDHGSRFDIGKEKWIRPGTIRRAKARPRNGRRSSSPAACPATNSPSAATW